MSTTQREMGPTEAGQALPLGEGQAKGLHHGAGERPLRITIVVETFARDMGYVSNTLPKYLARLGHHVDVITSQKLPYFQKGTGSSLFGSDFASRNTNPLGRQLIDGYAVHTLVGVPNFGYTRLQGLGEKLDELAPNILCTLVSVGWIALDCARAAGRLRCKLVIGNHTGKTHFPLAYDPQPWYAPARLKSLLLRALPGRVYVGSRAHHCVVPTTDCADIATDFFGIERNRVRVLNLPVDNDHFHPVADAADGERREALRASLGIGPDDVVCVYSGKFTEAKNPLVLAQAIRLLADEGHRVKGLFIGDGEQQVALAAQPHVKVVPFIPFSRLGEYFRAADIGVWMDESISYLDAASCGLPLVLGSTVKDVSHLVEFTTVYRADDPRSLADALRHLLDAQHRCETGRTAGRLAGERFSALGYAQRRIAWFREALAT